MSTTWASYSSFANGNILILAEGKKALLRRSFKCSYVMKNSKSNKALLKKKKKELVFDIYKAIFLTLGIYLV